MSDYILVTPAKNEAEFIEKTIQSVCTQTLLPKQWIIVDDGSNDETPNIVKGYVHSYPFIKLVSLKGMNYRSFGAQVKAFRKGYDTIKDEHFEFIGTLDADIGLPPNYYEKIIEKFYRVKLLGIAGGVRFDYYKGKWRKVTSSSNSVSGAVQMFRKKCYDNIGGYKEIQLGGQDAVAEITARMRGWKVSSFSDLIFYHYRCTGTADGKIYKARFRDGEKEYLLGYHPLFEIIRCLYRMRQNSFSTGCFFRMAGFFKGYMTRKARPVSQEFVEYLRNEQIHRIKSFFTNKGDKITSP